jgi:dCMP deaminase
MNMARTVAGMSTCDRRQVGCVLVDSQRVILSTGVNGVPPNFAHCRDNPGHECPGIGLPSGTGLDQCEAIHSEINALISCPDISRVDTVYCTSSPCVACTKVLLRTSARRIVFIEEYPHPKAQEMWTRFHLTEKDRAGAVVRCWHRTWEMIDPATWHLEVVASSNAAIESAIQQKFIEENECPNAQQQTE